MVWIYFILLFILLCAAIFKHIQRRYFCWPKNIISSEIAEIQTYENGTKILAAENILSALFGNINYTAISKAERERLQITEDAFVYGEIEFLSFIILLHKANPKPQEIFYDLGSGSGKAVFTAALCFELVSYGIEYLPALDALCNQKLEELKNRIEVSGSEFSKTLLKSANYIKFLNQDFLECDFNNANIIFLNATCCSFTTLEALFTKFQRLKKGCRIIIVTKRIPLDNFQIIYEGKIPMSWGSATVRIYLKTI